MKTRKTGKPARSSRVFALGVRAGMTLPATIYVQGTYVYPNRNDLDAMRSDVLAIGRDMKSAVGKVIGKNVGTKRVA